MFGSPAGPQRGIQKIRRNLFRAVVSGILLVGWASLLTAGESVPPGAAEAGDFVRGPLAGVEEIIFALRPPVHHHYYENFGRFVYHVKQAYAPPASADAGPPLPLYGIGGRLCRMNLATGHVRDLLDDPQGGVRDPQVHYDGRKILFSYRRGGEPCYHLYEIGSDGSGLVQLTDGPYDDVEPSYLPDGDIVFCSTRGRRYVGCNPSPVAILYRCGAAGEGIRPFSASPFTDNTPWMLPDGRVLYTRWEYVDRNQLSFHHLWTANPDGTGVMTFFGNQYTGSGVPIPRFSDVAMLDAKPIPGTDQVVASFSPDHGRGEHLGAITIIDPRGGPDALDRARKIAPSRLFRDPYPLSSDCILAADARGIWAVHPDGTTLHVYQPPDESKPLECHEPRPLAPRPREPVIAARSDEPEAMGRFLLGDVYRGRNMEGVQRGEIKRLLVLEQLPKPAQFSGGQEPLTIGGPFTLTRVLGTVPVEPDGSAHFEVPALRPVFFVALDEHDLSVKRMHSFANVMPGETAGCVGCHEPRAQAPHAMPLPLAASRPPSALEPIRGLPEVLDFVRDVQPILDRHCVACHNADRWEGQVDLSGDRTPMYSQSYWSLIAGGLVSDGRNYTGNSPPRSVGSAASPLLKYLDGTHYDARPDDHERAVVRVWIESGATYPGTYASLGCGMSLVQFPRETIERRCAGCHSAQPEPYVGMPKGVVHYRFGGDPAQPLSTALPDFILIRRLAYFKFGEAPPPQELCNLSQPEKSLLIRAPLAAAAGGLELCGPVFGDVRDPDYEEMLVAIRAASDGLNAIGRFDMPGFRPNKYYLRLMQEYGVLPGSLPEGAIDPYKTDQAYWRSLWYRPASNEQ